LGTAFLIKHPILFVCRINTISLIFVNFQKQVAPFSPQNSRARLAINIQEISVTVN
jgi:hypothetical protein